MKKHLFFSCRRRPDFFVAGTVPGRALTGSHVGMVSGNGGHLRHAPALQSRIVCDCHHLAPEPNIDKPLPYLMADFVANCAAEN